MRISSALLKNARAPQNPEKVVYQGKGSLRLEDQISDKNDSLSNRVCLHEMALVFACFKKNNFKEDLCHQELSNFQKCFDAAKSSITSENTEKKGPLSRAQVNKLLLRFPNL